MTTGNTTFCTCVLFEASYRTLVTWVRKNIKCRPIRTREITGVRFNTNYMVHKLTNASVLGLWAITFDFLTSLHT